MNNVTPERKENPYKKKEKKEAKLESKGTDKALLKSSIDHLKKIMKIFFYYEEW